MKLPQDDFVASNAHKINHTNILICQIKVFSFWEEFFVLKPKEGEKKINCEM